VAADAALPFLRMRREAEQKKNGEKSEKATILSLPSENTPQTEILTRKSNHNQRAEATSAL